MKQHPRELSNFLFSHLSSQFSEEKLNSSDTRLPFSSWLGNRSSSSRRVQMSLTLANWARCVDADGNQGTPENVHLIKWRKVNSNDIHLKPASSSRLDSVTKQTSADKSKFSKLGQMWCVHPVGSSGCVSRLAKSLLSATINSEQFVLDHLRLTFPFNPSPRNQGWLCDSRLAARESALRKWATSLCTKSFICEI